MRVIMSGGGTGGHTYPAIAIADTIKANFPSSEIIFTGNSYGIEKRISTEAGYEFVEVECSGFARSLSPKNIKTAYLALTSPKKGRALIKEFRPDIVIGTGGYVCWPTVKAASQLGVHCALHESNSVPGLAVKMLKGSAERIWTNYEETINLIGRPQKSLRVGNPIRSTFTTISPENARKKLFGGTDYRYCILSCGGSIGAERLNECAVELMSRYISMHPEMLYIHITGKRKYDETYAKYRELGLDKLNNVRLLDYTDEMPLLMGAADIVISRSGALTLSELALTGKAAVLVPSPNVTNNHQYHNSKVLADKGAAIMVEEKDLCVERMIDVISMLADNALERKRLERNIKEFAYPDANQRILDDIIKLTGVES